MGYVFKECNVLTLCDVDFFTHWKVRATRSRLGKAVLHF